jgi:hypothetical protein
MIAVIDTSSLLSLVRYYLPFDRKGILKKNLQDKVASGEILIIDKVIEECGFISRGIVLKSLVFLTDSKFNKEYNLPLNTEYILPPSPAKFYKMVDNNFVIRSQKARLKTEAEYDSRKSEFLNSADIKIILTSLNQIKLNPTIELFLVTEETEQNNDNKLFKKIPAICKDLDLNTINVQQLIEKFEGIEIEII